MQNVYDRQTFDFTADRIAHREIHENIEDLRITRLHSCNDVLAREYAREIRDENLIARVLIASESHEAQFYARDNTIFDESDQIKISTSSVEDVTNKLARHRNTIKTIADVQFNTCTVYFDSIMHVLNKSKQFDVYRSTRKIEYDFDIENNAIHIAMIARDAMNISNNLLEDLKNYKRLKRKIAVLKYYISKLVNSTRDEDVKKKFALIMSKKKCEREAQELAETLKM